MVIGRPALVHGLLRKLSSAESQPYYHPRDQSCSDDWHGTLPGGSGTSAMLSSNNNSHVTCTNTEMSGLANKAPSTNSRPRLHNFVFF